jgi:hypothetical protein
MVPAIATPGVVPARGPAEANDLVNLAIDRGPPKTAVFVGFDLGGRDTHRSVSASTTSATFPVSGGPSRHR